MSSEPVQEKVRILDKEYVVACNPEERDALLESARLLDEKMREIRDGGKIIGTERITVMAALNIAHDLVRERQQGHGSDDRVGLRLRMMRERIEAVLDQDQPQLRL